MRLPYRGEREKRIHMNQNTHMYTLVGAAHVCLGARVREREARASLVLRIVGVPFFSRLNRERSDSALVSTPPITSSKPFAASRRAKSFPAFRGDFNRFHGEI